MKQSFQMEGSDIIKIYIILKKVMSNYIEEDRRNFGTGTRVMQEGYLSYDEAKNWLENCECNLKQIDKYVWETTGYRYFIRSVNIDTENIKMGMKCPINT